MSNKAVINTRKDLVVGMIGHQILQAAYRTGDTLDQARIIGEPGVSRTPVRETLICAATVQ